MKGVIFMLKKYLVKDLNSGKEIALKMDIYQAVRYLINKNYSIKVVKETEQEITEEHETIEDSKKEEKEEVFKCNICEKEFGTQRGLNAHMRVHSGGDK